MPPDCQNTYIKTAAKYAETTAWKGWISTAWINTAHIGFTEPTNTQGKFVWDKWSTNPFREWHGAPAPALSPEEQARNQLIARNRRQSRELRARNAGRRATRLLLANLTPEQRSEWESSKYFHVETANGQRRYRIDRGHVGNIHVVQCDEPPPVKADRIRAGTRLCAHVSAMVPDEDHVLAQKLLLESEGGEAEFLQMANVL